MTPACRQCGSASVLDLGPIPDGDLFAGQQLDPPWEGGCLYECRDCHLGFRHPIRAEHDYERLYEAASDKVWVAAGLRPDQVRIKQLIDAHAKTGSVLDVGCYDGTLLQALGAPLHKVGVEASLAAAEVARTRGVEIIASKVSELTSVDRTFDVVCAVDVIEHMVDPGAFLETLSGLLAPGGLLLISTGSIDTPAWREVGGGYWYCSIPEHISFVSPRWGRAIATRLGLTLFETQRFVYEELEAAQRAKARRRFRSKVIRSRIASMFLSLLGKSRTRSKPRRRIGRPGVFADHVILGFRKPAQPGS